jgi:hypothetical protein
MSKTIKVVEKNEGKKIGYELDGTTLWIGDTIAIKLPKYQLDTEVTKDICADELGNLVMGLGKNYVAQVTIYPKEYEYVEQKNEETGETDTVQKEKDFDISKCTLTLWSIEEVYINE